MRLCNFIVRDAIIPSLAAPVPPVDGRDTAAVGRVKEAVVREMVSSLHAAGHFRAGDVDEIVKAVMRREQLGTTGIGRHIAIPHSRHPAVDRLIGTLALSCVTVDSPMAKVRAAAWFNALTRMGIHLPLLVVHDVGLLMTTPAGSAGLRLGWSLRSLTKSPIVVSSVVTFAK